MPPIKRKPALQGVSRDHHYGLLLCWKIRTGFSKQIEVERIKKYADHFFHTYLSPHFGFEEEYMFNILGLENELVKKAMAEHRRLRRLFNDTENITKSLGLIEEELEMHIRFEERILFNEIQAVASEEQLKRIEDVHSQNHPDEFWDDEFWLKS